MGRKKGKHYQFPENEIICGMLNHYCKHCGLRQICIRKVFFGGRVHFEKLCAGCLRHSDYLPVYEIKWALGYNYKTHKPIGSSGCKSWNVGARNE